MAYSDALTGLANRAAFEEKLEELRRKQSHYSAIWCICADVNNLKQANDTYGHAMGDELIRGAAQNLQTATRELCEIYRTGGDEFVLFLFDQSEWEITELRSRFDAAVEQYSQTNTPELSVALGCDRLRKKLRTAFPAHLFVSTIWGKGYVFVPFPEETIVPSIGNQL